MAKRIFWKKSNVNSDVPCAPCPFAGKTVNTPDEFIKCLQDVLFVPNGGINDAGRRTGKYPCVEFSTKNPHRSLLFAGTGFCFESVRKRKDGTPFKWCLFDDVEGRTVAYYDLREADDLNKVFDLFEDDAAVQRQMDALTALVKMNGGISFRID